MISVARWSPCDSAPARMCDLSASPPSPRSSATRAATFARACRAEPGSEAIAGRDLDRDANVVGDRELGKDLGDLERARHAAPHALVGRERGDVASLEPDRARGRREQAADQVEERRLAGAVRADDRAQFAGLDGQRHVVDGDQAAKALRCARRPEAGSRLRSACAACRGPRAGRSAPPARTRGRSPTSSSRCGSRRNPAARRKSPRRSAAPRTSACRPAPP